METSNAVQVQTPFQLTRNIFFNYFQLILVASKLCFRVSMCVCVYSIAKCTFSIHMDYSLTQRVLVELLVVLL